jgi:hypothetical protein
VNGQGSAGNRLTRVYIGTDAVGYTSRGDLFNNYDVNTEHTFPQSLFSSNDPMLSDIHHLFPTDVDANFQRGNLRFGDVTSGVSWTEGGSQRGLDASGSEVFEPRDAQKGASARAILYFVTRYQNYGGFLSTSMEETMREWHFTYLPNEVDENRNEDIFEYQNNRNPFVDYPELVHRIHSFRTEENRPNVGELYLSHNEIDFGVISSGEGLQTFNLVLVNHGERFFNLSSLSVTGSGFALADGQELSTTVSVGEAFSIQVSFDPAEVTGLADGLLSFNTNVPGNQVVEIPVSAEGVLNTSDVLAGQLKVYPNPAGELLFVEAQPGMSSVSVLALNGQQVLQFSPAKSYDLDAVAPGMYLLRIEFENGVVVFEKLIKN